jgi:WD40 repeat protein
MVNFIYRLNSEYIATSSLDKTVKIWKVDGFVLVHQLKAHKHFVSSMVSTSSNNLATCSADEKVIIWE